MAIVGSSGFVGSLLEAALAADDIPVVGISRRGSRSIHPRSAALSVDIATADRSALAEALEPCEVIYFLAHALGETRFAERDLAMAHALIDALGPHKPLVVHLSPLGRGRLSRQVASRHAVGAALAASLPTVEVRVPMVLGAGSITFEILVEVIVRWGVVSSLTTRRRCQPLAAEDLVAYLRDAPNRSPGRYEIAGGEVVTYRRLVEMCAQELGARVRFVPLRPDTLGLSARLLAAALDVPVPLAESLLQSLQTDMVTDQNDLRRVVGAPPLGVREGIRAALANQGYSATSSAAEIDRSHGRRRRLR